MPKWGLTPEQRSSQPWNLSPQVLQPAKVITDPIHGDIFITELERLAIDSRAVQRLRRIRQLGTTHLVYPGATHTRFSHSLGALRCAQDLLDIVIDHRYGPRPTRDLFSEWKAQFAEQEFDRRVAEATVLARLGALLHDLCHVPFGHSIEDDLGLLDPHDSNEQRFELLWNQLGEEFLKVVTPELKAALRYPLILSKLSDEHSSSKYPFVADIVGNTICADLLDYLRRDHTFTGLPAKLGNRFIQGFYVTASDHALEPQRMVLQISREGREPRDVVSELFKYLRYRYELSERVLVHHAKLAADAMVGKMLEMWKDAKWNDIAVAKFPRKEPEFAPDLAELRRRIVVKHGQPALPEEIDNLVSEELEQVLLRHGDDGLIEHVLHSSRERAKQDRRRHGVVSLAEGLLNRQLFKQIGRCSDRSIASGVYAKYGGADHRAKSRELEEKVSQYLGLEHRWHVLLWIPSPTMRLKAADVLVDYGGTVSRLQDRDRARDNRGKEIYDAHESLWSVGVYAHPTVASRPELCHRVLAWLTPKLGGVRWQGVESQPDLVRLAVAEVGRRRGLTVEEESTLAGVAGQLAAHDGDDSFEGLVNRVNDASMEAIEAQGVQPRLDLSDSREPTQAQKAGKK